MSFPSYIVPNYKDLRESLPLHPMMPSAPFYDTVSRIENLPETRRREEMIPVRTSSTDDNKKRVRIEAEIKKAQLRKKQLMRERQIMEDEFKARESLLDAEMELALSGFDSPVEDFKSEAYLANQTGSNYEYRTQDQFSEAQRAFLNANRIERPRILPESFGLEQLSAVDSVSIRQLVSGSLDESYEVVSLSDLVILRVNLSFGVAIMPRLGQKRTIKLKMYDGEVRELIDFRAGADCMDLLVDGKLACQVRRAPTYFKPVLLLHDILGQQALKIKGPNMSANRNVFSVQTLDKRVIGSLDKSPHYAGPAYAPENYTVIKFPADLDVNFKAAIIASSFLIATQDTVKMRERRRQAVLLNLTNGLPRTVTDI